MVNMTRAAVALAVLSALAGCDRGGQAAPRQAATSAVAATPTSAGLSGPEAAQQACDVYKTQHKAATTAYEKFNKSVPQGASLDDPDAAAKAKEAADALDSAASALQSKLDQLSDKLNDGLKKNLSEFVRVVKKMVQDLRSHAPDSTLDDDADYYKGASNDARAVCGIK
ncbi:hypothetical protein [Segniliparus rugosus]|uniref:Small secreted protein n=1 Tax=Segniliparus rugosus (strain ATCC BAA-974 / DSM 45345 / CCUG 50838 / CIP 108380 / JCM 13579 / CDC 945) TaxID=679197 RepID=E5XLQ2_SEGRC|nr:hypothetical protein [Segniliparus rugosus]EFV14730.2 hypothetical protein HMPREF9336_00421 [Segniliparus rugosus ATCC BAA-974]